MTRHDEIQLAAYYLWEKRGRPFGTPELDWFQAEREMEERQTIQSLEPALVAAARKIGSALGTVVTVVDSLATR